MSKRRRQGKLSEIQEWQLELADAGRRESPPVRPTVTPTYNPTPWEQIPQARRRLRVVIQGVNYFFANRKEAIIQFLERMYGRKYRIIYREEEVVIQLPRQDMASWIGKRGSVVGTMRYGFGARVRIEPFEEDH